MTSYMTCKLCKGSAVDLTNEGWVFCNFCGDQFNIPMGVCFECSLEKHNEKEHYPVDLI